MKTMTVLRWIAKAALVLGCSAADPVPPLGSGGSMGHAGEGGAGAGGHPVGPGPQCEETIVHREGECVLLEFSSACGLVRDDTCSADVRPEIWRCPEGVYPPGELPLNIDPSVTVGRTTYLCARNDCQWDSERGACAGETEYCCPHNIVGYERPPYGYACMPDTRWFSIEECQWLIGQEWLDWVEENDPESDPCWHATFPSLCARDRWLNNMGGAGGAG